MWNIVYVENMSTINLDWDAIVHVHTSRLHHRSGFGKHGSLYVLGAIRLRTQWIFERCEAVVSINLDHAHAFGLWQKIKYKTLKFQRIGIFWHLDGAIGKQKWYRFMHDMKGQGTAIVRHANHKGDIKAVDGDAAAGKSQATVAQSFVGNQVRKIAVFYDLKSTISLDDHADSFARIFFANDLRGHLSL
jgi:hypothetical protein